jgi:hypothetical protein
MPGCTSPQQGSAAQDRVHLPFQQPSWQRLSPQPTPPARQQVCQLWGHLRAPRFQSESLVWRGSCQLHLSHHEYHEDIGKVCRHGLVSLSAALWLTDSSTRKLHCISVAEQSLGNGGPCYPKFTASLKATLHLMVVSVYCTPRDLKRGLMEVWSGAPKGCLLNDGGTIHQVKDKKDAYKARRTMTKQEGHHRITRTGTGGANHNLQIGSHAGTSG